MKQPLIIIAVFLAVAAPLFYLAYIQSHGLGENAYSSKAACEQAMIFQHLNPAKYDCKQVP